MPLGHGLSYKISLLPTKGVWIKQKKSNPYSLESMVIEYISKVFFSWDREPKHKSVNNYNNTNLMINRFYLLLTIIITKTKIKF